VVRAFIASVYTYTVRMVRTDTAAGRVEGMIMGLYTIRLQRTKRTARVNRRPTIIPAA
jgi:hypothetical protein